MASNNSVVLAGYTYGGYNSTSLSSLGSDMVAVKLDEDGKVIWRWQVRCPGKKNRLSED